MIWDTHCGYLALVSRLLILVIFLVCFSGGSVSIHSSPISVRFDITGSFPAGPGSSFPLIRLALSCALLVEPVCIPPQSSFEHCPHCWLGGYGLPQSGLVLQYLYLSVRFR